MTMYIQVALFLFTSGLWPTFGSGDEVAQSMEMPPHIMLDSKFWELFQNEIEHKKSWKCSFADDILNRDLEADSKLYSEDTIFTLRRNGIKIWQHDDTLWSKTLLGACRELALERPGVFCQQLRQHRILEAVQDFVQHINYFYQVAYNMETRGEQILVSAQGDSTIHDIDKLDPVMLVGYSERFEDNKNTSLWNACVSRHLQINRHHQQHCLWHTCCQVSDSGQCEHARETALREMVCDKASRRLQKNLEGRFSEAVWDVDIIFYDGLPNAWVQKAKELMQSLKNSTVTTIQDPCQR